MEIEEIGEEIKTLATNIVTFKKGYDNHENILKDLVPLVDRLQKESRMRQGLGLETENPSLEGIIRGMFTKSFNKIQDLTPGQNSKIAETKAQPILASSITGTGFSTNYSQQPPFAQWKFHMRQLCAVANVDIGNVIYPQESSPNTTGTGSFMSTGDGSLKAQINPSLTHQTLNIQYIAAFTKASKSALQDISYLQNFLSNLLAELFYQAEDKRYLPILFTGATAGVTGETQSAAKIMDYIQQLPVIGHSANAIIITPAGYAALMKTRSTQNQFTYPGAMTFNELGIASMMGIPIFQSNAIPTGYCIVGDFSKAIIFQAQGLTLESTGYDSTDFENNLYCFRVEARCDLGVTAPKAFITGTF